MWESRRRAKFLANFIACRHQYGGIPSPARRDVRADRSAGYLTCRIDDLLNGEPLAVAKIVKAAAALEGVQSQDMRPRKIDDMDIIANARPITGRVVISKNGDLFALSERNLQNERKSGL